MSITLRSGRALKKIEEYRRMIEKEEQTETGNKKLKVRNQKCRKSRKLRENCKRRRK